MKTELYVGDTVFNSPVGSGIITGITERGYPQVNHVAVARLVHKTEEGEILIYDPHHSYNDGKYKMCSSDYTGDPTAVSASDIDEAIMFIKVAGKQPNTYINKQGQEVAAPELMFV